MRRSPQIGVLVLAAALCGNLARGDTIALNPSKDNTLYENLSGATSNGEGSWLFAGKTGADQIRRGLLAFDIAGNLPSLAVIESVTLTLTMDRTISGSQEMTLHRVSKDWGEGTSDAGGNGGMGTAATVGDATWLHTFFNSTFWTTPGGDFEATASANQMVDGNGAYTWGSTASLVADVQGWLDQPSSNFGWLLQGNEQTSGSAKRFVSGDNPMASIRPSLFIEYRLVPEPSSWVLVGLGVMALAAAPSSRRRPISANREG